VRGEMLHFMSVSQWKVLDTLWQKGTIVGGGQSRVPDLQWTLDMSKFLPGATLVSAFPILTPVEQERGPIKPSLRSLIYGGAERGRRGTFGG
jgi:hypothetical protein